jgi:pimeloyl-ACP methyl ester carboxylesterase
MRVIGTRHGPLARPAVRKAVSVIAIAVASVLAGVLALVVSVLAWSPGRPRPYLDASGRPIPDSISEKTRVPINGVEQGMFIKSTHASHPVLLYLHGGIPDYFLAARYPTGLDENFTMVWWDQRGSGLSYHAGMSPANATAEQLVSDAVEVTHYLRKRFGKEKIYLMGRSGGTFLGIQVAARFQELYHAYIGVGQMSDQLASEQLAYDYMLQRFKHDRNITMVRKLEAAPVTLEGGVPAGYLRVRDEAMHRLGVGTMREMGSVVTGLFLPSLRNRDYTLAEKINLWRGVAAMGVSSMWTEVLATDLAERVPRVGIPVYFLHGVHDYTVSYQLAKAYYERLEAPVKGFYTFHESAHSPLFEEPEKACRIMREDVLTGATRLADPK